MWNLESLIPNSKFQIGRSPYNSRMMKARSVLVAFLCLALTIVTGATSVPTRAQRGMVASQNETASRIGADVIRDGGTAVDAAVAVAFALAVVHPTAGNIGGGGFMVLRTHDGTVGALDFRETAPAGSTRDMYVDAAGVATTSSLTGHRSVAVPGSVA